MKGTTFRSSVKHVRSCGFSRCGTWLRLNQSFLGVNVMPAGVELATLVEERLLERNRLCEAFFAREAPRLAEACREMSERFLRGGRLLAFGRGPYATDAPARFGGICSSRDCRQTRSSRSGFVAALPAMAAQYRSRGRYCDGLRSAAGRPGSRCYLARGRKQGCHDLRVAWYRRVVLGRSRNHRPVYSSGDHRDSLSHIVGDGARVLRAPRAWT